MLEIAGDALNSLAAQAPPKPDVTTSKGKIENAVALPNPETKGWRISFELIPDGKFAELRARLMGDAGPLSESWVYRWTV